MLRPFLVPALALALFLFFVPMAFGQGCYGGAPASYAPPMSYAPASYGGYERPFGHSIARMWVQMRDPYTGSSRYVPIDVDVSALRSGPQYGPSSASYVSSRDDYRPGYMPYTTYAPQPYTSYAADRPPPRFYERSVPMGGAACPGGVCPPGY